MTKKQTMSERFDAFLKFNDIEPTVDIGEKHIKTIKYFLNSELTSLAQEILSKKKDMTLSWGTENQETIDFVPVSDILAILEEQGVELEK